MKSKFTTLGLLAALAVVVAFSLFSTGSAKVGAPYFGPLGVAPAGSPYRYVAVSPGRNGKLTVVERIARDGGWLRGWWTLHGEFQLPPLSFNGSGTGVSADGNTLVLSRFSPIYPPRHTELAILDTRVHPSHPHRGRNPRRLVMSVKLAHSYTFHAISPHGTTIYLERHLSRFAEGPFEIREMRTGGRRGASPPLELPRLERGRMAGAMLDQVTSVDGRWFYTLYGGKRVEPFVYALDTVHGRAERVDLPPLHFAHDHERFDLALRMERDGRRVELLNRRPSLPHSRPLLTIDTRRLQVDSLITEWEEIVGRSAEDRPIRLRQFGDPALRKSVLVFGCIHGDECGASGLAPTIYGCPDTYSNVYVVPSLNPDGVALGTRLNAHGVDLNRNFPAAWTSAGAPGDPEYPGDQPLSEPESRLATHIVARLEPRVTIWFHQYRADRPLVRAWGQSVASARRFARLAGITFKAMPWPDGTAPNWQNHRFPGAASFVVELPRGRLGDQRKRRLEWAIVHLARWVSHDGHVVRTR